MTDNKIQQLKTKVSQGEFITFCCPVCDKVFMAYLEDEMECKACGCRFTPEEGEDQ